MAEGNSTYTLQIFVTGLMLFAYKDGAMHVLLPTTDPRPGEHGGSQHHGGPGNQHHAPTSAEDHQQHFARLYYDPDDDPTHSGPGFVSFDGRRWTPPAGSMTPAPAEVHDHLISLTTHIGPRRRLPSRQIEKGQQTDVEGHLVLAGGSCTGAGPSLKFAVAGAGPRRITNTICWTIPNIGPGPLKLNFKRVADDTPDEPVVKALVPANGSVLTLHLMYAPDCEHNDTCIETMCKPEKPNHFHMYGRLLDPPSLGRIVTCIPNTEQEGSCDSPPFPERSAKAKVIYTCMLAQAELG